MQPTRALFPAAIVPGKASESLMIKVIRHEDAELKILAKAPKLPDAVIADYEKWIDQGAVASREGKAATVVSGID